VGHPVHWVAARLGHKAPPPSFAALIDAGTVVVPDEHDGPYSLGSYHANVIGAFRGYKRPRVQEVSASGSLAAQLGGS
jgi:hypothetical protein